MFVCNEEFCSVLFWFKFEFMSLFLTVLDDPSHVWASQVHGQVFRPCAFPWDILSGDLEEDDLLFASSGRPFSCLEPLILAVLLLEYHLLMILLLQPAEETARARTRKTAPAITDEREREKTGRAK